MKKSILMATVGCICLLSGCFSGETTIETRVNALKRPITIVSISGNGDVLLTASDGKLLMVDNTYYMSCALAKMKAGDVVSR